MPVLSLLIAMLFIVDAGFACTCGDDGSPRAKYDRAKVVFAGIVTDISDEIVKLKVTKIYKGGDKPIEHVELIKYPTGTTCDVRFTKGEKYLVYADYSKPGGKDQLMTEICAGTNRLANADKDIKYLEAPNGEKLPSNLNKLDHRKYKKPLRHTKQVQ